MTFRGSVVLQMITCTKNIQEIAFRTEPVQIDNVGNAGRESHKKNVLDRLHAKNFELNGTQETLKDISACNRFVCETSNESV